MSAKVEHWKPIPGFPRYEASTEGRIRSRVVSSTPRIMRPSPDNKGYLTTRIVSPDGTRTVKVHVVIARTFLGPRPAGLEVRHLDGDNRNNRVGNLMYGTPAENVADRVRHKTHCKQGHEFNDFNSYQRPSGGRACRPCLKAADEKRRAKRQGAAA